MFWTVLSYTVYSTGAVGLGIIILNGGSVLEVEHSASSHSRFLLSLTLLPNCHSISVGFRFAHTSLCFSCSLLSAQLRFIHNPSKHTSAIGARPSRQQYSLFSCCNTLSADCSTFHFTTTRHEISNLNVMLGKQINGKRKKRLTNSSFSPELLLLFASSSRRMRPWLLVLPLLVCHITPY
jgi:hypothetical protein